MNRKIKKFLIKSFLKNYLYYLKLEKKSFKDFFWVLPRRKNFVFEYFEENYWWQIDFWIKIFRKKDKKYFFDFIVYFSINEKNKIFYMWETTVKENIFQNKKIWNTKIFKEDLTF